MKTNKIILSSLLVMFLSIGISSAQNSSMYSRGDLLLSGGISFGSYGYGYVGSRSLGLIPLTGTLEYSINPNFSIGAYAGYASWKYRGTGYDYKWSISTFGARASYHATPLLNRLFSASMNAKKLDLYASAILGFEVRSYSGDSGNLFTSGASDTNVIVGPLVGCRYFFSERFAGYVEGGRGAYGVGTIGLSFKL